MFNVSALRVDPTLAVEGAWVDYLMGSKLRIARANNKDAETFRMQKAIEHADTFNEGGEKAEELAFQIENETIAYFILKDWSGVILEAGETKETKYTPEAALILLNNPEYTDFRDDVLRIARNRQNFRNAAEAEATEVVKKTAAS